LNPGRRVSSALGTVSGSSLQFLRWTARRPLRGRGVPPCGLPFSSHPRTPESVSAGLHVVTGARKDATTPCSHGNAAGAWGRARGRTGIMPAAASGPSSCGASSSCATSIWPFRASSNPLNFSSSCIPLARGSAAARAAPGIDGLWIASRHLKLFRGGKARPAAAGRAMSGAGRRYEGGA